MSKGVNKVILVGNLGRDPEIRYGNNQSAVANCALATSESWKDKNTGEKQEKTEWHRVVFFGRLAEVVGEYLKKGSQIYVEGRLQTRKWQDKEGKDRYTTEIVASEMQMLGSRNNGGEAANRDAAFEDGGAPAPTPAAPKQSAKSQDNGRGAPQGRPTGQPARKPVAAAAGTGDFDDDIPF